MAYTNKEKLLKKLEAKRHEPWMEYNAALGIIIAEEVVKQSEDCEDTVVHAYWIPHLRKDFLYDHGPEFEFVDDGYVCSNCRHYEDFKTNYCSNCGAKMDKVVENG